MPTYILTQTQSDCRAHNILHPVSGLDGLDEKEVLLALGEPYRNPVLRVHNGQREAHALMTAPKYLVYPVIWDSVDLKFLVKTAVKII